MSHKKTIRVGNRVKNSVPKEKNKSLVVGHITGNLIPEGFMEVDESIGRQGQTIYERRIKLVRCDEPMIVQKNVPRKVKKNEKPKILLISDVKDWAWWIKSTYIKKYLSDEFDFDIVHVIGKGSGSIDKSKYNLYLTYGWSYVSYLNSIYDKRKITGVTAHRTKKILSSLKGCKWHHANSILLLKELNEWGIQDVFYVPNGVDEELFRPIREVGSNKELVAGHVGKKTSVKGQKAFIIPAIEKSKLESFTHFNIWSNMIPFEDMYKEYQKMDFMLVASQEDGTPNPALEAMACGRPVISNRIGNMPEIIKDGYNGFLVEKNVDAYVEKIEYFKNNRDELIRMGRNARKSILNGWTWKEQSENYRTMFRTILKDLGDIE